MCTINHLILYIPKVNQNMNLVFLSFSYKYEIHLNNNSAVGNKFFFVCKFHNKRDLLLWSSS